MHTISYPLIHNTSYPQQLWISLLISRFFGLWQGASGLLDSFWLNINHEHIIHNIQQLTEDLVC